MVAYQAISDLLVGVSASFFGVVVWFSPPMVSRGDDVTIRMRLVDESSMRGVFVVIFRSTVPLLPDLHRVGDIVRLVNMDMMSHQNSVQAVSNQKNSSFVVFDHATDAPRVPPVELFSQKK